MSLYAGLISGTSMDGVEAVALEISAAGMSIRGAVHVDYPQELGARLRATVADPSSCDLDEFGALDAEVGDVFAQAMQGLLQFTGFAATDIRAIGSHGQTVLHRPQHTLPFTIQIGDPNRIAELTGIDVVADFRRRDMAAGGEGAPLVPAFHAAAFAQSGQDRVVVNIGGISNISVLTGNGDVFGFDTGPGNCLMDLWAQEHLGTAYDKDGAMAARGTVHATLLRSLLTEPFLRRAPPKSTGRELFHRAWLNQHLQPFALSNTDVQATLCEFTAQSIATAIATHAKVTAIEVLVCGGGAYNLELMRRLDAAIPTARVASTAMRGIAPQHVEAALFAWLAHRYVEALPGNLVAVTGAKGPRVLGGLYRGK
jgi:anhydro-N-acetylmuramic acid kinase